MSHQATNPFKHAPLNPNVPTAMRIVRVAPRLRNGLIDCTVEHTQLGAVEYCALSYEWEAPDNGRSMMLNGHEHQVRQNLWEFLEVARSRFGGQALWIDALCINQKDTEEKSKQVQMMSKIYLKTRRVLVWLGPHVEAVAHTMRLMRDTDLNELDSIEGVTTFA